MFPGSQAPWPAGDQPLQSAKHRVGNTATRGKYGAGDETRTRDPQLGRLML